MPPPTTLPKLPLPKLLLASALTLAIHSTLHAATDIESAPDGTSQNASASVTSSDPSNTITATAASGAPDANGGNATASATLTPTSDSNSTLSATGGASGPNNLSTLPTIGGNASASATVNATGNVTLTLAATGGAGDTSFNLNPIYGTGGNSNASAAVIASGDISINVTSQGGAGGGFATPPNEGIGGTASINSISAISASGNITLVANDLGGNGNTGGSPIFRYGVGADASVNNAFSVSTSGNITLTQNATGGVGRVFGNANSSLTFTCLTAASITANVNANPNLFFTSNNSLLASNGSANAYADVTGNANVVATANAIAANTAAPATATAIVHAGLYPGFSFPLFDFAEAQATASSNVTANTMAEVYTSNAYFPKLHIAASSNLPSTPVATGIFIPKLPVINYNFVTLPLTTTVGTAQANPDNSALVNEDIRCTETSFAISPGQTENFFDGEIDGILDPSLLPEDDLILKLTPQNFFFHSVELSVQIDENTVLDKFFTNLNFGTLNQSTFYDLGSLQSFGSSPFDFTIDCHVQMLNNGSGENMSSTIGLYDMNPALLTPEPASLSLLTPEPASLSLLTLATLPLLLKRRRPNKLNTEQP